MSKQKKVKQQSEHLFLWLVATLPVLAFVAPFGFAVFCPPTALTDDFIIPVDRVRCQTGIMVGIIIQVILLALILWRINRKSFQVNSASISATSVALLIVVAVSVFSVYLLLFTYSAEWSLFSADQDVTNVSTAINRTTFTDILPTPYVAAGSSRSFLAHHFSPSILLFLPVYKVALLFESANHNTYNIGLAFTLIVGLALWYYYSYRSLPKFQFLLPLVLIPLAHSFLFFRQILSFHFEVLTLPLLALLVLSIRLKGRTDLRKPADWLRRGWPMIAILYAGIKEDAAVYLGIFAGIHFLFEFIDDCKVNSTTKFSLQPVVSVAKQSIYFRIGIISVLWVVFAMLFRLWLAGENAASWQTYWDTKSYIEAYPQFRKTPYSYFWILLSSGVWLFFSLRSTLVVAIILLLHVVSGMPWHALLESHYSYTLLPFMIVGSIRGLSNIANLFEKQKVSYRTAILLFFAGTLVTDYSLLREKNQPFPLFKQNLLYESIHDMMKLVPDDACVQSSFHLSALVPLRARPIPLSYYEGSPFQSTMPEVESLAKYNRQTGECKELYRFQYFEPMSSELKQEINNDGTIIAESGGKIFLWKWNYSDPN